MFHNRKKTIVICRHLFYSSELPIINSTFCYSKLKNYMLKCNFLF